MPLKAATFNVNSIRARAGIVIDWLGSVSPDILCLQETKVVDEEFPARSFEESGYHASYRGEKGYNGVAVLSRVKPDRVRFGFDETGAGGTRLIAVEVKGISIVNTYVPQGFHPLSEQFREKIDWLQRLQGYFDENWKAGDPLIWLGDFNVAPGALDVYDPVSLSGQVGFHPDEQAALERLRLWGFVDLFRLHHPDTVQFTFWDYRVRKALDKNLGWRIDHIWATAPLARQCRKSWVDDGPRRFERPSDHTPVVAEFDI